MNDPKSVIGEQLIVRGDLAGEEDLVIYGRIQGDLKIDGSVVLESSGIVKGTIDANAIIIRGILIGDAHALDFVEISPQGRMIGNIHSPHLILQDGGALKGQVKTEAIPAGERKSGAGFERTSSRSAFSDRTSRRSTVTTSKPRPRPGETVTSRKPSSSDSMMDDPFRDTVNVRASTSESKD